MSKENRKKKGIGWFKTNNPSLNKIEKNIAGLQVAPSDIIENEQSNDLMAFEQSSSHLFSKENQDKMTLDLLVPLENMLKDRQLLLYKNKGLNEQIRTLNEINNRLKQDIVKKDQSLQEKNKEVRTLENNLTNKQMSYDQLLEDYKDSQTTSSFEYERISNLLEIESNKYTKLSEESTNTQYQNMLKINELEEKIRNLEIEGQRYLQELDLNIINLQ